MLVLAHESTGTRVRDGKHRTRQAGREQSQREGQCTSDTSLFHPLAKVTRTRKALLKLQTTQLPDCSNSPSQTALRRQLVVLGASPTQAAISKICSKGHGGQAVEEAAEVERRGHQGTPRADSGQGLADGVIWPSVTGNQACSPKRTDVPGAETEYGLLSNFFFYSRLLTLLTEIWLRKKRKTQEILALLPSSRLALILPRIAMGQSLCTKADASSTSQLQPALLSMLSQRMKKCELVFVPLLHRYLLFISGE